MVDMPDMRFLDQDHMDAIVRVFQSSHGKRHVNKSQATKVRVTCQNDDLMDGDPSCSAADFKQPRLRRCAFDPVTIDWRRSSPIGGGLDGFVWKVWFGDSGPYALKLFWEVEASECNSYFAFQRECQNAAILQMIETQLKRTKEPILVDPNPTTKGDALDNLMGFSQEYLQTQTPPGNPEMIAIPAFPRMAKCYGWLEFGRQLIQEIPRRKKAPTVHAGRIRRFISPGKDYVAIIYEYIEEGSSDAAVVEAVDKFLWLAGFCHCDSGARNWRSGVLVDHSAIVYPRSYGWVQGLYKARKASLLLRE